MEQNLGGNRRIIFKTDGLLASDVIMSMNRLLGNPIQGKLGKMPDENT